MNVKRETRVLRKWNRNLWKSIARNRVRLAKLVREQKKLREELWELESAAETTTETERR